jgi:flagellar biosynthesis/type III secretory pathway protein FliH
MLARVVQALTLATAAIQVRVSPADVRAVKCRP